MKILGRLLALCLGGLGLLFLVAAGQGNALVRIVIGSVLLVSAVALIALSRLRPQQITHQMQIDVPGDTSLEEIHCRKCGASIRSESIHIRAGAAFVHCEYCGAEYQMEEAPRW